MIRFLRVAAASIVVAGAMSTVAGATAAHAYTTGCQPPPTPTSSTTTCAPDQLALSSTATRVATQATGEQTGSASGDTLVWTFWEDVYSDPNNVFCHGCLTWIVKIANDTGSNDSIERVTISNFSGFEADLGILTDASGNPASEPSPPQGVDTVSPALAPGTIAPNLAERSASATTLGWEFTSTNIAPNQSTVLLEAETNATQYTAGTVTVQDGIASYQAGYAPALPEFGMVPAFALVGGGLIGAGAWRRRRRARQTQR